MSITADQQSPTVGIVGAGQLARMLYQAAIPLGIRVRLLAERPDDAAAQIAPDVMLGSPQSSADLAAFAATCDVITFDHELVNTSALAELEAAGHTVWPATATVMVAQDKLRQRAIFAAHGFPVPAHRAVSSIEELAAFAAEVGWPVVLKAARGGYDGRGVWVLENRASADDRMPANAGPILVEAWVPIEREIAVLVARRPSGQAVTYPVVETVQRNGMCHQLTVPAPISDALAEQARRLAVAVAVAIGAVGIMALELFVAGDRLVVNEIAVRPHNSGHFSIEGADTSQFEQHLRAILDWPLGTTTLTAPAVATVNLLGGPDGSDPRRRLPVALAIPGVHVHLYGKEARPGRKLGHVTTLGSDAGDCQERAWRAATLMTNAEGIEGLE